MQMNAQMICQRGSTALQSQRVKPVTEQKCAIRSAAASRPRTLGSTIRMSIELDQNGPTAEGSVVSRYGEAYRVLVLGSCVSWQALLQGILRTVSKFEIES